MKVLIVILLNVLGWLALMMELKAEEAKKPPPFSNVCQYIAWDTVQPVIGIGKNRKKQAVGFSFDIGQDRCGNVRWKGKA